MVALTGSAHSGRLRSPSQGIRPFDIGRDLRPVSRLIADSFAEELDEQGKAALRELRMLGHMSGIVGLLARGAGGFQNAFNGFVWVEDNLVVGNVTVQRAATGSGRWQIANVAVSRRRRGRGIGRALMEHALEYIRDMGGSWAVLQVRGENSIARGLYERMRFENLGGTLELHAAGAPRPVARPILSNLRAVPHSEGDLLYELIASRPGAEQRWWRAARRDDFQLPLERRVGELIGRLVGRERIFRSAIRDYDRRFEGAIEVTARCWQGEHRIRIWLRPEAAQAYARPLMLHALALLGEWPRWPVKAEVSTQDEIATETLLEHGFSVRTTLYTMRLRM